MSDHRGEIRVDKRLTPREMHEPNAVAFRMSQASFASSRVAECLDDTGSLSRAKLQKPQRALQALVMAKWQVPGPPSQTASSAIFQIEGRFGTALAIGAFAGRRTSRGSTARP